MAKENGLDLSKLKGSVDNISPTEIRFTQDSISKNLSDGRSVQDLIDGLSSGSISPDSIPPIRIFQKDGNIYALDNRRLYAFQQAGISPKTVWATPAEIARETAWKMSTTNGGTSIIVRGVTNEK